MPDVIDQANEASELALADTLARIPVYAGESAETCEICGDDIPPARREAVPGCTLCVACQQASERRPATANALRKWGVR